MNIQLAAYGMLVTHTHIIFKFQIKVTGRKKSLNYWQKTNKGIIHSFTRLIVLGGYNLERNKVTYLKWRDMAWYMCNLNNCAKFMLNLIICRGTRLIMLNLIICPHIIGNWNRPSDYLLVLSWILMYRGKEKSAIITQQR